MSGNADFSIKCKDDTTIEFTSIDELLAFSNTKERQISKLTIKTPYSCDTYVSISFKNIDILGDSVEYDISGADEKVILIENKIKDNIDLIREWYPQISAGWFLSIIVKTVITITILEVAFRYLKKNGQALMSPNLYGIVIPLFNNIMLLLLLFVLFFVGLFAPNLTISKIIFPVGSFAIGDGIRRYNQSIFWRRTVIAGFIVSVVAGLVTILIQSIFSK